MAETHTLLRHFWAAHLAGHTSALATVVHVDGSSYRKPGARMLVTAQGSVSGAVSGGCVERAVAARAQKVIASGQPDMLVYDGRHRLGCDGTLHILIEPLSPADPERFFAAFEDCVAAGKRASFEIHATYALVKPKEALADQVAVQLGSRFDFPAGSFAARPTLPDAKPAASLLQLHSTVKPPAKLYVIGTEVDATVLAQLAADLEFEVTLVSHPRNPLGPLPKVKVQAIEPAELLQHVHLDASTSVVLMSHNYARDLAYLTALCSAPELGYLGILGPARRRNQLLNDLVDADTELPAWMPERVYGPAGIDLRGELPSQIALAILAEIVGLQNQAPVSSLREKHGTVHGPVLAS